jgi:hypothetical protein
MRGSTAFPSSGGIHELRITVVQQWELVDRTGTSAPIAILPPVLMKRLRFVSILGFVNRCPDIIRLAHGLGRVITADLTHASRKDHAECITVFGWSLRRHPDMEAIGALVELQFRIAA